MYWTCEKRVDLPGQSSKVGWGCFDYSVNSSKIVLTIQWIQVNQLNKVRLIDSTTQSSKANQQLTQIKQGQSSKIGWFNKSIK